MRTCVHIKLCTHRHMRMHTSLAYTRTHTQAYVYTRTHSQAYAYTRTHTQALRTHVCTHKPCVHTYAHTSLCVHMYAHTSLAYTRTHTQAYAYTHTHTQALLTHVHTHKPMHTHIRTHKPMRTHVRTHKPCVHTYAHTSLCIHTYAHTSLAYTRTHTQAYAYTHTHTQAYAYTCTHTQALRTHVRTHKPCVHTYTHTSLCIHTYAHTSLCVHMYAHTSLAYTCTHTQALRTHARTHNPCVHTYKPCYTRTHTQALRTHIRTDKPCVHTYAHTSLVYTHTHTKALHTHIHTQAYVYTHKHFYAHRSVCIHMYTNTSLYIYTVQYAQHCICKPSKHMHTQTHAQRFLALVITMGVVNYPSLHHYWSRAWPFHTSTFSSIMSRDRFLLLLKFLHLANNTEQVPRGQPGHDRLYKLRAFSSAMIRRFKACYRTHREIAIDESMIGFKGRLSFLQYMPKKPTKWGMKAWVLADSRTGYTWNWELYTGREDSARTDSLATHVVLKLVRDLPLSEYHVYFDNFYTSPGKKVRRVELNTKNQ